MVKGYLTRILWRNLRPVLRRREILSSVSASAPTLKVDFSIGRSSNHSLSGEPYCRLGVQ